MGRWWGRRNRRRCGRGAALGRLTHEVGHAGPDLLIAATALEHGLTVVTRNVRHFQPTNSFGRQ